MQLNSTSVKLAFGCLDCGILNQVYLSTEVPVVLVCLYHNEKPIRHALFNQNEIRTPHRGSWGDSRTNEKQKVYEGLLLHLPTQVNPSSLRLYPSQHSYTKCSTSLVSVLNAILYRVLKMKTHMNTICSFIDFACYKLIWHRVVNVIATHKLWWSTIWHRQKIVTFQEQSWKWPDHQGIFFAGIFMDKTYNKSIMHVELMLIAWLQEYQYIWLLY